MPTSRITHWTHPFFIQRTLLSLHHLVALQWKQAICNNYKWVNINNNGQSHTLTSKLNATHKSWFHICHTLCCYLYVISRVVSKTFEEITTEFSWKFEIASDSFASMGTTTCSIFNGPSSLSANSTISPTQNPIHSD